MEIINDNKKKRQHLIYATLLDNKKCNLMEIYIKKIITICAILYNKILIYK